MESAASPRGIEITIKPITSESDLPRCAHLTDIALKPDGFREFKNRYGGRSLYEETLEKLTEAFRNHPATCRIFKAVVSVESRADQSTTGYEVASDGAGAELIVGFTHWHLGYIEFPKMDPFAIQRKPAETPTLDTGLTNIAVAEAGGQKLHTDAEADGNDSVNENATKPTKPKPFYSAPDRELARKLGNTYIRTIRGKRHVCIGQKLLDWGVATADRENIVAWLFCRPAGYKLYERNGWKVISSIEVEVPEEDLTVAPVVAMLRSPANRRN
ncbi:hypothetical protein H2200_006583 [Cladophialophora chaetospira]|uniref:Uncharacterized protein n=1 Tax=Cladophialophora chaetospira TaxID=386627 RepID=A0AA38X8L6_9EURO|nr:hypothetical protein H2200_006583 [Cladophialophora chaetospira]